MTLAPLQLPLYRFTDEVGATLAILQNRVHSIQRSFRESRRNLFVIDLFSSHAKKYPISTNLTSPPECDII